MLATDASPHGCYYATSATPFGELALVWREEGLHEGCPRAILQRIYLPRDSASPLPLAQREYARAVSGAHPAIAALCASLGRLLQGEQVAFDLALADLASCSPFQQRVLRAEHAVPRGCVTTYGRLAGHLGTPRAARAVGSALAHNPFPLLIPCHRALRSDLALGGFQGGPAMKQALLEMEGLTVVAGQVCNAQARLWYNG